MKKFQIGEWSFRIKETKAGTFKLKAWDWDGLKYNCGVFQTRERAERFAGLMATHCPKREKA